jgi:group I intron endonuclease
LITHISCIYTITSTVKPDALYIGSAISFHKRKLCHLKNLRKNKHCNKPLQNHVNKYGLSDLTFNIIEVVNPDDLIKREQYYLDTKPHTFNICKVAGSTLGKTQPANVGVSVGNALRGRKLTDEHKRKCSESLKGRKLTDEHKRKIGRKGHNRGLGLKRSDEFRANQSKWQIGHEVKESTREKLRIANLGKKQSAESSMKKRIANYRRYGKHDIADQLYAQLMGLQPLLQG